jgi:hypothetical protein
VTDNTEWQPPSGTGSPPPPPSPVFAPPQPPQSAPPQSAPPQFAAPQSAPPQFAAPQFAPPQGAPGAPPAFTGHAPGGQPGWTPPPKPGLIPLRPLGFGTLLGASFQVIRRNPRATFGISLALNGVVTLLFVAVIGGVIALAFTRVGSAAQGSEDEILAGAFGAAILASLVPMALSVLVSAVLQGLIALEVSRGTIGEKLTVRGLWRLARGRVGALVGWAAIMTIAVVVVVAVVTVIIVFLVAYGGEGGIVGGIILGLVAALAAAVVWFWLATKLSLIPSVLLLERVTLRDAIARSWSLTDGYFWRTLGTQLLVNVIVQVAAQVVTTPVSLLIGVGGALVNPNGGEEFGVALLVAGYVLSGIIGLVFGALATVTSAAVTALIYIDIRMRKEGLDLELARFVEARQVGVSGVGNPYLPPRAPTRAPAFGAPTPPPTPTPPADQSPWA